MISVTLFDSNFSHTYSRNNGDLPILSKYVKFDRENIHDIIFYTDNYIKNEHVKKFKNKKNIAWLIEPYSIDNLSYKRAKKNIEYYDYILSHDKDFINHINEISNKGLLCEVGGSWIIEKDRLLYDKSKNVSIIASNKRITYGHNLRHQIIENYNSNIDMICGRGYHSIYYKLEALKDYRFSITIENDTDTFTEKLIDCLVTGTIPIYYGPSSISDIFDMDGIILFKNIEDFENKKQYINQKYYEDRIDSVKNNYYKSLNYVNSEDLIYNKYHDILFIR